MRILVLGGTRFLGPAFVESAITEGHTITLFNRGQTDPDLFPDIETLTGDREEDLRVLEDRRWDAVVDTSGYLPRIVRRSVEFLRDAVDLYLFVSTVSVYDDFSRPGMDESGRVGRLADEDEEEVTGDTYGPLKALCERIVRDRMPERSLIIRPGLIVGPHDPTDRFTYWPYRIAQGGRVLAPGNPDRPIQFIDVRDLADWMLRMVVSRATGTFNAVGPHPDSPVTMGDYLKTCKALGNPDAELVWVEEDFLLEHEVAPWTELPLWLPESDPQYSGFSSISSKKAIDAGLKFRRPADTLRDTLSWVSSRPADYHWKAGLHPDREVELLRAWDRRAVEGEEQPLIQE